MALSHVVEIREFEESDRSFYLAVNRDHNVMKHIGEILDVSEIHSNFDKILSIAASEYRTYYAWLVSDHQSKERLGFAGMAQVEGEAGCFEFGMMFKAVSQGHGYGSETMRLCINSSFEAGYLREVICSHHVDNKAANHVLIASTLPWDYSIPVSDEQHARCRINFKQWQQFIES